MNGFKMLNQLKIQPRSQGSLRSRPSEQQKECVREREQVEYGEDRANEVADKNCPKNSILQLIRSLFLTKHGEPSSVIQQTGI